MMLKLPVINLFSKLAPSGITILLPSVATTMQVPANRTPLPNETSPDTVKWSSSVMFGIDLNRFSKFSGVSSLPPRPRAAHRNLLEVVSKLHDRCTAEFSRLVHRQHTVLEVVQR